MPDSGSKAPRGRALAASRPRGGRHPEALHRVELLVGSDGLDRLAATRVILFGAGGVGSTCAEALVRSGLGHLTLVDPDRVATTNLNRQAQALVTTLGELKVEALRARLLAIRPEAEVQALAQLYNLESRERFGLTSFDYVLDAIDGLSNKVGLILHASALGCRVFSSMGAAQKLDATRVKVGSLWKSEQDPLARVVRRRLRRRGFDGELTCVYSDEKPGVLWTLDEAQEGEETQEAQEAQEACETQDEASDTSPDAYKARINGSLMHVTATFGLFLAQLVITDVLGGAPRNGAHASAPPASRPPTSSPPPSA